MEYVGQLYQDTVKKEFPKGWESTTNKVAKLPYSVLKSEGKLRTCRAVHCNSKKAYAYSKAKAANYCWY